MKVANSIVERLTALLGADAVLTGADVTARARNYWDPAPLQASAVLRPRSTEQVAQALKLCHEVGQPVVTHGGLTGVCLGDQSGADDIVVSLERMNRIEEIDTVGRTARVQAGCILQSVQEAVAREGLFFALDLGARGSCTVGGNAATNAGGINVIRYGMMRDQVLGLETVLADGTVLSSMNRMLKNNAGYDLKQLFIGSEGTLGVITRLVLKLREESTSANTAFAALSDFDKVVALLKHMDRRSGGCLTSYEVMWGDYFRCVTEPGAHRAPLGRDHDYYVVMEVEGADEDADTVRFTRAMEDAMAAGLVEDVVLPKSKQERDRLWEIRENFEAILQYKPQFLYDVSLPIRDMGAYVQTVRMRVAQRWPDSRFFVLGHIGDGNLHFVIAPGVEHRDLHAQVDDVVYAPLREIGGSVSAEHGIGLEKRAYLPLCRSTEEISLMRTLKRTLDPKNILNPGKVLPLPN